MKSKKIESITELFSTKAQPGEAEALKDAIMNACHNIRANIDSLIPIMEEDYKEINALLELANTTIVNIANINLFISDKGTCQVKKEDKALIEVLKAALDPRTFGLKELSFDSGLLEAREAISALNLCLKRLDTIPALSVKRANGLKRAKFNRYTIAAHFVSSAILFLARLWGEPGSWRVRFATYSLSACIVVSFAAFLLPYLSDMKNLYQARHRSPDQQEDIALSM